MVGTWVEILIGLSAALSVLATPAAAVVIDSFRDGRGSTQPGGISRASVGPRTVDEAGLKDVLGGVRRVRVEASSLDFPGADSVAAAIVRAPGRLSYDSTVGADGSLSLVYDGGGSGLNSDLSSARGIAIKLSTADPAAVPCGLTLTVVDESGRSASVAHTVTDSGRTISKFFLRSLRDVNLRAVRSVAITIDPGVAGDIEIQWIRTFGRSPTPARVGAERGPSRHVHAQPVSQEGRTKP